MGLLPVLGAAALFAAAWNPGVGWETTLTKAVPGPFPEPEPIALRYAFGWSGLTAAEAKIRFSVGPEAFSAMAEASTMGLARTLWQFDMVHRAKSARPTLRPISFRQSETLRTKKVLCEATFSPKGVSAVKKTEKEGKTEETKKKFRFAETFDLFSAYLFLRSLDWKRGDEATLAVFPVYVPYLVHVESLGTEKIKVPAGEFETVKLDIKIRRIGRKRALEPFKKFKRATVWVSNDADRLVLKVDAEIFIGSIFAELRSFDRK